LIFSLKIIYLSINIEQVSTLLTSAEQQRKVLNKILNSEEFRERDLYQKFLAYLVEASISGSTPKEVTIAQDVFEKGDDFNAALDTTVRVYAHNLRNKLDHYYQTEGADDPLKIQIPKGHYRVEFVTKGKTETPKRFNRHYSLWISSILCIVLIIYITVDKVFIETNALSNDLIDTGTPIWRSFFDNGFPTSIVIGDFLVFHEYDDNLQRARRIQDYQINTVQELDAYISNNPNKGIESWALGELPHNSIFNLYDLNKLFLSYAQTYDISFTTEIDINFIKNRNIFYIGEFKNLRALSDLISNLPVKYQTLPWWQGLISFQTEDSLVTLRTSHDWGVSRYVVDLGLFVKLPGSNNENYVIICGIGYDSQIKIVKIFSEQSSLIKLEEQITRVHGYIPEYFTIVFEVRGFDRASTTAEMKFFYKIEDDYYKKFNP
jgi:hypothetical protein